MRAIGFGNETSIWVSKQFRPNHNFGSEFFFKHNDWRYSVIPVYQEGNLARIVMIKENPTQFPPRIDQEKITDLSGNWSLKQIKMMPDLQMSTEDFPPQEIKLDSSFEDNQSYFLPEKIYLNLPKIISEGRAFEIIIGKQITANLYKQIKTQYEPTGKLIDLISEVYSLGA